ncbi:hypothetical protein PhCBS80983_g01119 [Powellomyces hirtus]|uniref:GH26 domain-containing protein n=1 Tax=Powellomyces hirtus TaxID=109895 RepID=A0A507ECJ4_9FUNG|nr:hypothetical protein PhCBS80983_g01119 [Powellomyces hirtus]
MFQMAVEIPLVSGELPPVELLDATNTDAILYMTVFPRANPIFSATGYEAYEQLAPQGVIDELVELVEGYVKGGRKLMIRIASEMNGGWNAYSQRPIHFIALWRRIVDAIRARIPASNGSIAFLWSPNSGNGYPFPRGAYSPYKDSQAPFTAANAVHADDFKLMDTNSDGVVDSEDDPYSPYWPGPEYVDWVGLSLYYFGLSFPWLRNQLPTTHYFLDQLEGGSTRRGNITVSSVNFYDTYSGPTSAFKKPMIISETAAAFHISMIGPPRTALDAGPGSLALKQAYWRQYITNSSFLLAHPALKGICLFEWEKDEEETFRDYRSTWSPDILAAFKADFQKVAASFIQGKKASLVTYTNAEAGSAKPTALSAAFAMYILFQVLFV